MCGQGRGEAQLPFPPRGETFRGGGFDNAHQDFFTVDKQFRQPCFLATSFSQQKAEEFLFNNSTAYERQGVLWVVRVNPAGEHDVTQRCKHVNFVAHSHVRDDAGNPSEQEYLFSAYSIFTVRSVTWGEGGAAHRIELDAASDNRKEAVGGAGRWATPERCDELPLAPWC